MFVGSSITTRRNFLAGLATGTALFTVRGAMAEELTITPRQTEGPFYPDHLPLDTDNDLLIVNDGITPAVGEITHLSGTFSMPAASRCAMRWSRSGKSTITAAYLHSRSGNRESRDGNFQGFGAIFDRFDGRVLLPYGQAGPLSRPDAAHSLRGEDQGAREVHDAVLC